MRRPGALAGAGGRRETQTTNRITGQARWWALGAVLLSMFFASLDQTVVSTALPVIVGDLKGLSVYAWVFTAYMMASAITVPIYGKLSDIYGRKPFYIFGLVVFMIGSAVSGQAHTMLELILARGAQGIGAGALMSMPRATIGDIFNPRERGRWMGVIAATFGISSIVGPTIGGWITDSLGWRWVFYVNLPVAAVALIAVIATLPRVRVDHRVKLDWRGSVLMAMGLVPFLLALTWAGGQYGWGSPVILAMFAAAAIFLALFVWNERRAAEPVLDPSLFSKPIFTVTVVVALFVTMGMFGTLMFLPLYVQGVIGMSAQGSGEVLTPMMLSFVVASVASGWLMSKTGRYKLMAIFGALFKVGGTLLFTIMGVATTWPTLVRNMIVMGFVIGTLLPLLNVAVQNAFPYKIMGVVNATQQFVRSLGGVIIAPILGTLLARGFVGSFQAALPPQLQQMLASLPPAQRAAMNDPQGLLSSQAQDAIRSSFARFGADGQALYQQFLHAVRVGLNHGMSEIFLVGLVVAILAFLATFLLPELGLKHDEFFETDIAEGAATATSSTPQGSSDEAPPRGDKAPIVARLETADAES
ncbi:MAG: MDR family MFS transporter [Deinococcales bacterium]